MATYLKYPTPLMFKKNWEEIYTTWYYVSYGEIGIARWRMLKDWCDRNLTGEYTAQAGSWLFELEEDAVAYKLVWYG